MTYDPVKVRQARADAELADLPLGGGSRADGPLLPLARRTDPGTSHAAARSMAEPSAQQRRAVLAALVAWGPGTSAEIDDRLGWPWTTTSRRMKELETLGLVERTGDTRRTPRGRLAEVWRAIP